MSAPPLQPPLQNTSSPRDKEPPEVEKVLKWQEERIARKLKGEYESAVVHLSELVSISVSQSGSKCTKKISCCT
jgi:outer membrane protein insertion porin family